MVLGYISNRGLGRNNKKTFYYATIIEKSVNHMILTE